jgi:hypothetical protein
LLSSRQPRSWPLSFRSRSGPPNGVAPGGAPLTPGSPQLWWRAVASIRDDRLHQHRAVLKAISEGQADEARERMAELLRDSVADVRREMDISGISKSPRPA